MRMESDRLKLGCARFVAADAFLPDDLLPMRSCAAIYNICVAASRNNMSLRISIMELGNLCKYKKNNELQMRKTLKNKYICAIINTTIKLL